uniref:Rho-GAP domain-containing protein n=2 Tax=Parascaris univalens TaxID=6257 RepID=A0A915B5F5_PARUN
MDNKSLENLRSTKICRRAPSQPPPLGTQILLEQVGSYNLDFEIGDQRGFSTYTLREVPMFLFDAFKLLRAGNMVAEGIFRKEGNLNRIKNAWPTYFGCKPISKECTTHDICSMIKRFFRELKTPLLFSQQSELLDIASQYKGRERIEKLLDAVRQLPPGQLGTLSFLMRQLKYFGENHEKGHHMTTENLALVFAPTLFRHELPAVAGKKKKGSQENVISSMCSDYDLKATILLDLIENAHKIGVPRDYYIASRQPSDKSHILDKSRSHKISSSSRHAGSSPRSSSCVPSSRHHTLFVNDDLPKTKSLVKRSSIKNNGDVKLHRGRRSSSTMRELFTTISNKVLRRGLSPGGRPRRASDDSAGGAEMVDAGFLSDPEKAPTANSATDGVSRVFVSGEESGGTASVLSFKNEEAEKQDSIVRVLSFKNIENIDSPRTNNGTSVKVCDNVVKKTHSRRGSDDSSDVVVQRRSRRESPRKHLTVNSRVKPMDISPHKSRASSWMPASPAEEPSEMATKQISSSNTRSKESNEKKIIDGKILKRNSSKASKFNSVSAAKVLDPSSSMLDEYGVAQSGRVNDRRRRHTTPVRPNALLRRNQPNTVATGLKTTQVRIRDRRSTTSFGMRTEENANMRRNDKKKRSSSSALSCSDESHQNSDEENARVLVNPSTDASAILQQKGLESRERRAKRHKRREGNASSKRADRLPHQEIVAGNLLDDVTNELERLERGRSDAVSSLSILANAYPTASVQSPSKMTSTATSTYAGTRLSSSSSISNGNATAVTVSYRSITSSTIKISPVSAPRTPAHKSAHQSPSTPSESQKLKRRSGTENSRRSPSKKSSAVAANCPNVAAPPPDVSQIKSPPLRTSSDTVSYGVKNSSVGGDSMRIYRRTRLGGAQQISLDENEFAQSDDIKKQILNAATDRDIRCGPAHMVFDARPSVAYIQRNNRGIVQKRVNQFAQLGNKRNDEISRATRLSVPTQDELSTPDAFEFMKPIAPPASHGLRHVERRQTLSPTCSVNISARMRKFEALAKAASERNAHNGITKKTSNATAKVSRQMIGERREARVTRQALSKSLGKLELLATGQKGKGRRASLGCLSNLTEGVRFVRTSPQRTGVGTRAAKLSRRRLKYVNPILTSRTTNLRAIPELQLNI